MPPDNNKGEKQRTYAVFRYLVSQSPESPNPQTNLFNPLPDTKEMLVRRIFDDLMENKKTEWVKSDAKKFLIYGLQSADGLYILKFAKKTKSKKFIEGETDIEEQDLEEAKYVHIIISHHRQLVLIEANKSIFQHVHVVADYLADYLREKVHSYGLSAALYNLTSGRKFWSYIDSAENIYDIEMVMTRPNMPWNGYDNVRNALEVLTVDTNMESVDMKLSNKDGNLVISKDKIGRFIDYIIDVGGKLILRFKKDGIKQTKKSSDDKIYARVGKKTDDSKFSSDEVNLINQEIERLHKNETRDEI